MPAANVPLIIPEVEIQEAREAAAAFTSKPVTAAPKELAAAVLNEVIRKWRIETRVQPPGGVT